jgi:hypothetical protein
MLQKNSRYHSGINGSPYQTLFGRLPRYGIGIFGIPSELNAYFETEEELDEARKSNHDDDLYEVVDNEV